jgi:hypothetical protein
VTKELPALVEANFPCNQYKSITGHSMGGHGALQIAFKNSDGKVNKLSLLLYLHARFRSLRIRFRLRTDLQPRRLPLGRQVLH